MLRELIRRRSSLFGIDYPRTWDEFQSHEKREGWWSVPGQEETHLQGRCWAGRITVKCNSTRGEQYKVSIYDARPTFESYCVAHGGDRAGLIASVPDSHEAFSRNLAWVHEQECEETDDPDTSYTKLIAVHASLESKSADNQMQMLQTKDAKLPRIEPPARMCGTPLLSIVLSYKVVHSKFASTHNLLPDIAAHLYQLLPYLPSIDRTVAQAVSDGNHSRLAGSIGAFLQLVLGIVYAGSAGSCGGSGSRSYGQQQMKMAP